MSLLDKIGRAIGGDDESTDADSSTGGGDAAAGGEPGETGPNFMPAKQKELYVTAFENKQDLSETGTCSACGTTLSPVKAGRLLASCQNEDCENHLRENEITAVERFYERNGHPDELPETADAEAATDGGDGERTALDGLKNAVDEED